MKVLFVIPSKNSITGASLAIINIILGLLKKEIEVYIVASEPPPQYRIFLEKLEQKNAKMFFISSNQSGMKYWRSLAEKALQVIKENDIKIIHLHLPKLVYFIGKKMKKQNVKIVLTLEGDPLFEVKNLDIITKTYTKLFWNSCKKFSDVICPCSDWLLNLIKTRDKINNTITIHNPIDLSRFLLAKKGNRNVLDIDVDKFVITTAARLTAVKGIDVLISGFADFVKRTNAKATLLILGTGELEKKLKELSVKLGVKDQVRFLGFTNNPENYLIESDVFVMSSTYEPFGMPAAEAGVLGIPVIVSKAGGLTEIVIHENTGYQFEIGDYKQLSFYLERLFTNKELREKFGNNARERIMKYFSPEIIADKVIQIYSKLVS